MWMCLSLIANDGKKIWVEISDEQQEGWILSSCLIEHLRTPAWGNNQPLPPLWPWPGLIRCKLGERLAVCLEVTKWQVEQQEARIGYKAEAAIPQLIQLTRLQLTPNQPQKPNQLELHLHWLMLHPGKSLCHFHFIVGVFKCLLVGLTFTTVCFQMSRLSRCSLAFFTFLHCALTSRIFSILWN